MPNEEEQPQYLDPREEDIVYGDRRISRPDVSLPDWEVPDTSYRPVPIVWFTGALFLQMITLVVISIILSGTSGWVTIALGSLASGAIFMWTWNRGMRKAGLGWKIATTLMMAAQVFFLYLAVLPRL